METLPTFSVQTGTGQLVRTVMFGKPVVPEVLEKTSTSFQDCAPLSLLVPVVPSTPLII